MSFRRLEALHEELKADGVGGLVRLPGLYRPNSTRQYAGRLFVAMAVARLSGWACEGYEGFMGGHRIVSLVSRTAPLPCCRWLSPRGLMLAGLSLALAERPVAP